jgi:mono/diheme cytochrome c family protein
MSFKPLWPSLALSLFLGMPISDATASEVDAAGYYKLRCATCHGVDGEGTRDKSPSLGPPLRGNPLVVNAPAEVLASIIRHGRGGQQRAYDDAYPNMPAFDAGLVPDAVGLATYLKTVLQQQKTTSRSSDHATQRAPAGVVAAETAEGGAAVHEAAPDRAPAGHGQAQTQPVGPAHPPSLHLSE